MGKTKNVARWSSELSEKAMEFTQPEIMMKLIATVDPRGWPHITIITGNRAISKEEIVWGQFSQGLSKKYVEELNPKIGFIYMSADMPFQILQVKADFTHSKMEGDDIEYFNKSQLMRYMTYMRVFKVYYNKIVTARGPRTLSLGGLAGGIIKSLIGKGGAKTELDEKRLNVLGMKIFKGPANPKFIAYIDSDGYPILLPCIQLQAADHNRLVFPLTVLKQDLEMIPVGVNVAVLGMTLDLASQLVNGTYKGVEKFRGIKMGVIEIEEIYNSAPPLAGVYYPELYVRKKVTDFHL